jgi:hypothetical protein
MMRLALALLLAAALGCATPIASTLYQAPESGPVKKIALVPLADDETGVVTARLLQALNEETDLEVIGPGDALKAGDGRTPTAAELQRDFGVDALVTGTVRRFQERQGGSSGVERPAAVWFTLELRSVSGRLLWSGVYQEQQEALSDNLFMFNLAWQRGFRWVTAEELATYGARELSRAMASETGSWS